MRHLILILIMMIFSNVAYSKTVRVVYKKDGQISIIFPIKQDHTIADFDRAMENDPNLKGCEYVDIDHTEIPSNPDGTFKDSDYWIGKKGEEIKINLIKKNADIKKKQDKIKELELKLGVTKEELKELLE